LCSKSEFFRKRLQPKRKPFNHETDCDICTERLESGVKELTYCTVHCGNNFHYKCIERWNDEKRAAGQAVKCPFCRHKWATEDNMITVHRFPKISATAFSIFNDWLYHDRIAVEDIEYEDEDGSPDIEGLVKAYILWLHLKHGTFCGAVMEGFLEIAKDTAICPGPRFISYVYENTRKGSVIRLVMVLLYVRCGKADFIDENETKDYAAEFLKDLVSALFKKHPSRDDNFDLPKMKEEFGTKEVFEEDDTEENAEQSNEDERPRSIEYTNPSDSD
jgi:hypothetical protein